MHALKINTLLTLFLFGAMAAPGLAQNAGVAVSSAPGKVTIADAVERSASVVAINKSTRTLTLRSEQGKVVDVTAGEEVRNFDQIAVGDSITIKYVEALTLALKVGHEPLSAKVSEAGARAQPGEKPAGAAGREVRVLADVVNVDRANAVIALKGPQGNVVDLKVRNPAYFDKVKVGDQVEATYVEAVALAVTRVQKDAKK